MASDLGLVPNNDGKIIRIPIPPLTEERRREMVKIVKKLGEDGKVAIRNVRRDATQDIEKLKKLENLPEDEAYRMLRKLAMDKSLSLSAVAEQVITVAKLLG